MKLFIIYTCMFVFFACEPEPEPQPSDWTIEELITELASRGFVIDAKVKYNELVIDGELFGIYDYEGVNVNTKRSPLLVCDPFGWGVEYDWLCTMSGGKGRALGKQPAVDPVYTDVFYYVEQSSIAQPLDMTSVTYFSKKTEHYPNYIDTNADPNAFKGLTIAKWGQDWSDAVDDWCDITNPDSCIQ